jgi:trehalose 6-phosphate synthase/phosphatase
MSKIIIVSNRLPFKISFNKNDTVEIQPSVGGLATGMKSFYKNYESLWIGWPGVNKKEISKKQQEDINKELANEKCLPIYLDQKDVDNYYYGFSNETVWPLFHYFMQFTEYDTETWKNYYKVNKIFADTIINQLKGDEKIWVHDYHLLLLPKMIKDKMPDVSIGFFLHIPFPSFEVFRILPWRKELIQGMLGADLIGFHTFDYARHFISSVRRLLGYEINLNQIHLPNRIVKVDGFPMGIDYDKFHNAATSIKQRSVQDKSKIHREIEKYYLMSPEGKLLLSIDRLDYSKGIPNRLVAFEHFLYKYPEFREKVTLIMLCVPSRSNLEEYQKMKKEVDELVGRINGEYGTINWVPVWYFYRAMPFENLIEMYTYADIALLTPVRDGMNLVAKEYVATKIDKKGVLILSEMTGAAQEMSEALIINPNNMEEIADAIKEALVMPEKDQIERNSVIQERLSRYNVVNWAKDFMQSLDDVINLQKQYLSKKINDAIKQEIKNDYKKSRKRIFFLDYNGTLIEFRKQIKNAKPDKQLFHLLDKLSNDPANHVVLITGWDKDTFSEWFGNGNYYLIAEHGTYIKSPGKDWKVIEEQNNRWKDTIRPILENYADRTPGAHIEEKHFSLIWNYRKSNPEMSAIRAMELKDELSSMTTNQNFEILEGSKLLELKNSGVNKGAAAARIMEKNDFDFDFVFAVGDEWSDEYLYEYLPEEAHTIKIGIENTEAKYNIDNHNEVRALLENLMQ